MSCRVSLAPLGLSYCFLKKEKEKEKEEKFHHRTLKRSVKDSSHE
jgi:hypothetical protein